MARIKKYSPLQNLSSFQTFINDENPNSDYFRITEFKDTFTGGKNGFLIEGSEYLKESTEIKIELLDVNGDPIYFEPGNGIPEYYEGISKLIAVYIYNDTPIGLGKITVLGELKEYDDEGVKRVVPDQWEGAYNVKWERTFQVNKNISNEDRVRFYRRPEVTIDEINKPIFSNNSRLVTQTGTVDGIPLVPIENTNLSNFSLPTSYRLKIKTGNNWTGSIEGDPINFDNINYNPIVEEVVNETELIVTPPYSENGLVKSLTNENYSVTFPYLEGINDLATALTGSFAKIKITDMKTFVGDAARVKIFRRSQSNVTDFEFVQEIQLESNELLRDIETFSAPEELYGFFTEPIIEEYWVTSSNDLSVSLNQNFLYNSARLNSTGDNLFFTTKSLDIENDIEYSLDFNTRLSGSLVAGEKLTVFLSGSLNNVAKSQTIIEIPSSNGLFQKTNFNENFIADEFDSAQLYFDVNGSNWYINNLSLKASQETSFSPDVITFIQNVPKTLAVETFDYRFEFYDINNNYIPVLVEATKRFDGGNLNLFDKELEITPSNLYFTFDSASLPANPMPPTSIIFDIETSLLTGSISFTSGAYDEFGNFLSASEYAGGQYPGLLRNIDTRTPVLNVADFTGSRSDIVVQYIRFTGFAEGISDEVVITRVQDGKGGVNFEITPFRGTSIKNNSDKDLEIQAYRIDGINRIELKDGLPQTGFSDAKLRVLSSSIDPITSDVSSSYFLLSEVQTSGFIRGLTAGTTGSGEIDYNATFNRDSIDKELTVYLMDGPTSESILTSIILNDLQDGLASGFISFDAEQFGIKPRDERVFTPEIGRVTGSFYLRGTNSSPISGTLDIYPSMSVDPETKEPFYYMFYVTDSFDRRIDIVVTDKDNNIVDSGRPGEEVSYFVPIERKQLTTTFTYTEDITSASISVDKTFFSVPDGLPGVDSIIVDIDPRPVVLNADQRGNVFNYSNADTTITVTQGRLPLIFDDTKKPGTFTTSSITPLGIEYTTFDEILGDATMSLSGFRRMTDLTASVTYDLEIHPYFTGSFYTQSFVQQFKKTLEGADAINIELDPVSVTIDAEENGGIVDFSSANTTLRVKQGDTYMEFSTSSLVLPGTFSASLSPNQISIGTFSSSNDNSTERNLDDTLHFRDFNNFLTDSGSVDYQIKIYPFSITSGILSGSQTVNRKQLFSKNKEGIRARSVELSTTTEVANYDKDGIITSPVDASSLEPTSIFLTATPFNITSSQAYYEFFQEGFAVTFPGTNNQFEVGSGDLPAPGTTTTYRVDLRDGSISGPVFASKEVTISGVQSGANNYQVFLTNPSPTITVKVDGELDLSTTGTQIKAFKGTQELTNVQNYSSQQLDNVGDPIGTLGEFSSSIFNLDTYITQPSFPQGNPASVGPLTDWTLPQDNPTATVIYKVDIENGRATYFLSQSIASTKEGDVGPGLVFRGPWTGSIEYIYNKESKRRDSVLYSESGNEPYDTYYATKDSGSSFITPNDSSPGAGDAQAPTRDDGSGGREVNTDYWVSLGQEEFFVAAKLAIFEESFVKNTLNVGTPPTSYAVNPQITIAGGTDEPYIAVGQTGTIGFQEQGIWMGMSNSAGDAGTSILPKMSMKSNTVSGKYKSLEWNGETLTIRGALRQTPEGEVESRILAAWSTLVSGFSFIVGDTTSNNGITWECILVHDKGVGNDEPGVGSSYTTYWQESNLAAKTLRLTTGGQSFVEGTNGVLTPDFIEFTANKENIGTATSWTTSPSVTLYDASTGGSSTTTGDTVYLRKGDFGTNTAVTVTATAGGKSDEITVVRLTDGSNAITSVLSNESHTFQANSTGTITNFSDSGTEINAYEGTTPLTFKNPDQNIDINVNFEIQGPGNEGQGDAVITFSESDISSGQASMLQLMQILAELGILWVHDVNVDGGFQSEGVDVQSGFDYAKVKAINNTSGTNWEVVLSDEYEISGQGASGILFDFCAFDGDSDYQIRTSNPSALNNSEFTIEASLYKGFTGGQFPTIGGGGTTTGTIGNLTNFSTANGFINHVLKHKKANGDIVRLVKKQSFTRANAGVDGTSGTAGTAGSSGATGAPGAPGAGVVFRGVYDSTKLYFQSTERTDVVEGSDGNYYIVDNSNKNGLDTWDNPVGGSDWTSFGAQFSSVATDILLAQEVYVDQTINIGADNAGTPTIALNADASNNNENPFISIGQVVQDFGEDGIYLGYTGSLPVLSMSTGSRFLRYKDGAITLSDASFTGTGSAIIGPSLFIGETGPNTNEYRFTVDILGIVSASDANIAGTVQASSGKIGEWIIDETTNTLRDDGNEIILNPGDADIGIPPSIKIFSQSYEEVDTSAPRSMSVFVENNAFAIGLSSDVTESKASLNLIMSEFLPFTPTQTRLEQQAPATDNGGSYYFDLSHPSMLNQLFSFSVREDGIGTYGGRYNRPTTLDTSNIENQPFLIQTSSALPGNAGAYLTIFPSESFDLFGNSPVLGASRPSTNFYYYNENATGYGAPVQLYEAGSNPSELIPVSSREQIRIDSVSDFSSTAALNTSFTWSGSAATSVGGLRSNISATSTSNGKTFAKTTGTSIPSNTPITISAGVKTFKDITIPYLQLKQTGMTSPQNPTIAQPSNDPVFSGEIHGGIQAYPSPQQRRGSVYLEVINNDDVVIGETLLKTLYTYGPTNSYSNYQAEETFGGGGQLSVVGDTKITLSDGTTKLAKYITINDTILAWDDINKKWVSAKLSKIHKRDVSKVYKVTTTDGKEIEVSKNHCFWLFGTQLNSGKVKVTNLYDVYKNHTDLLEEDGYHVRIKDGDSIKAVKISKVEIIEKEEEVITFSVPHYVNYLSNGIISHNIIGGDTLEWVYQIIDGASSGGGNKSSSSETVEKSISIQESGPARLRYRWEVASASGQSFSVTSGGGFTAGPWNVHTTTFKTNTSTSNYTEEFFSNGGYSYGGWDQDITVQAENNFVEIRPAGIQVVSNNDRFVRIFRRELIDTATKLLEVGDGHLEITSRAFAVDPAASAYDDTNAQAIFAMGNILPMNPDVASTNSISATGGVYRPFALGKDGNRWKYLNGIDISGLAVSLVNSITGTTGQTTVVNNKDSYVKLPGGVIIQWGSVNQGTSYGIKNVGFPTEFPTSISAAVCSTLRNSAGGSGFNHVSNVDRNGMDIILDGTSGFWIAIGH